MKTSLNAFTKNQQKDLEVFIAILFYGPNWLEINKRTTATAKLVCDDPSNSELQIHKLSESELLKNPEALYNLIKTRSFFGEKQAVLIDGGSDKLTKHLSRCIDQSGPDDNKIIISSSMLKKNSTLRQLVENHPKCLCIPIYEQISQTENLRQIIISSGLKFASDDVINFFIAQQILSSHEPPEASLEKLQLLKFDDPEPVSFEDVENLSHRNYNIRETEMLDFLASGDISNMVLSLKRLLESGVKENQITNMVNKHFRLLYNLKVNKDQTDYIFNSSYPPVFGRRRSSVIDQSRNWTILKLERVLLSINALERRLRASTKIPLHCILERYLLRIASLVKR